MDAVVEVAYMTRGNGWHETAQEALKSLFAEDGRYPRAGERRFAVRSPKIDDGVQFAALIHPDNPTSGAYRGTSFVIFPRTDGPALVGLVVGTDGLGPDADVLGRPGHARKCSALTQWLSAAHGVPVAWAKPDPTRTEEKLPRIVAAAPEFQPHRDALDRYGTVMYLLFAVTEDLDKARDGIAAILDLLFAERDIEPRSLYRADGDRLRSQWLGFLFPKLSLDAVADALAQHQFVVLQGPPGTGKTRAALGIAQQRYPGRHTVVQFHANTTYETFVGGLAPKPSQTGLTFEPRAGHLLRAIAAAKDAPYLLVVDEINRADLAKVMGEALYLFEPETESPRMLELEHSFAEIGGRVMEMPRNLGLLGTMNTADRSIAIVDVAVRRRFAFLDMWPDREVVANTAMDLAVDAFDRLVSIFIEYAPEDAFNLLPGHSYFLSDSVEHLKMKLRNSLAPLLREYLRQGYVAGFAGEIRAYLQWLEHEAR